MLAARGQSHTTGRPTKTARAEGEPDSNVGAAPEAAVHVHLDGIDDVAQHADRAGPQSCRPAVALAHTVVGHPDRGGPGLCRPAAIGLAGQLSDDNSLAVTGSKTAEVDSRRLAVGAGVSLPWSRAS